MNALPLLAPPKDHHQTLDDLVTRLETAESSNNDDAVVRLSTMRMTTEGTLEVPGLYGNYAMNDWAHGQFARLIGIVWDKWFERANPQERADEINRRLARAAGLVRVRSTKSVATDVEASGTIRAFVSAEYSPISDAHVAMVLRDALVGVEDHARIIRHTTTDLTVTYVVRVGEKLTPSADVGEVQGCIVVRNSGVGYARLVVGLLIHRLICKNGLIVSLPGATLVRAVHRGLEPERVGEQLADGLLGLPLKIHRGAHAMAESTRIEVDNVELAVRDVLRDGRLPMRLVDPVMAAYAREPRSSRFGISQALTLAAQDLSPEQRFELERIAGTYLAAGR